MEPKTVEAWAEWHAILFGFHMETWSNAIAVWATEFAISGYTVKELIAATRSMKTTAPKWPGDHYRAINQAVQEARTLERKMAASKETQRAAQGSIDGTDKGVCVVCGNTKWAIVPHLKFLAEWHDSSQFVTVSVACSCLPARMMLSEWDQKRKRPMTLDEYGEKNHGWRSMLEHEKQVMAARLKTAGVMAGMRAMDGVRKLAKTWTEWKNTDGNTDAV